LRHRARGLLLSRTDPAVCVRSIPSIRTINTACTYRTGRQGALHRKSRGGGAYLPFDVTPASASRSQRPALPWLGIVSHSYLRTLQYYWFLVPTSIIDCFSSCSHKCSRPWHDAVMLVFPPDSSRMGGNDRPARRIIMITFEGGLGLIRRGLRSGCERPRIVS
jgi:hypothetical protein